MAVSTADAVWEGSLKEGKGTMKTGSGAINLPYSFRTRFEGAQGQAGTNPEELIGAAEAGCFTMQLAHNLAEAGHVPESVQTQAKVHIRNVDGKPTISQINLITRARVPGLDDATFQEMANATKDACIISRALAGVSNVTVDAQLES